MSHQATTVLVDADSGWGHMTANAGGGTWEDLRATANANTATRVNFQVRANKSGESWSGCRVATRWVVAGEVATSAVLHLEVSSVVGGVTVVDVHVSEGAFGATAKAMGNFGKVKTDGGSLGYDNAPIGVLGADGTLDITTVWNAAREGSGVLHLGFALEGQDVSWVDTDDDPTAEHLVRFEAPGTSGEPHVSVVSEGVGGRLRLREKGRV